MGLSKKESAWIQQYWTTANYIAAASIYLKDNFLLKRNLQKEDIKDALLGHWGTCPGINFIYAHLNLLISKNKQSTLLVLGPGHGFASILANQFLEGTLKEYYPEYTLDKEGIGKIIKSFCWPTGFPSHVNPGVSGNIHEGGELGYALGTAFGAALDNPDLLVAAIIGDGECETGPTAAAWHSNKFLNPKKDGVVLPIVHLNSYKISNPTIYGTMSEKELENLFSGYGYDPIFVEGDHDKMNNALESAYAKIKKIKKSWNPNRSPPRWPVILLRTPKGWTGIKKFEGKVIEGSHRSHQVPIPNPKSNPKALAALENWLKSYHPEKIFAQSTIPQSTLEFVPKGDLRIGMNPHAIGGKFRSPLNLPNPKKLSIALKKPGEKMSSSTSLLGEYFSEVLRLNKSKNNFRIFSPDELESNKLDAILKSTKRAYVWPHDKKDYTLSPEGRVMEILSEHTLQAWMQGYTLTGRYGIFPSYEAFLPIIESMLSQYLKFLKTSLDYSWRLPVPSLNYISTSVCWRQDHNGFSHQNPGFINVFINKVKEQNLVRIYFPADANIALVTAQECMQSTNRVNIVVAEKRPMRQWQTYEQAIEQFKTGAAIWDFASDSNPEVIFAACGDYQTQEILATIKLLKSLLPEIKIRFVNISELNVLGTKQLYPHALDDQKFKELFTENQHVLFSFHGYPGAVKQLLFDRPNTLRFHIYGYMEKGTTTTPFDMLVKNEVSRYHFAIRAIEHAAKTNQKISAKSSALIAKIKEKLEEHHQYIIKNGKDPEEINDWHW